MYDKNDKRRLYWILENYLKSKIDSRTFCDEFYSSYDLEIDLDDLTIKERGLFSQLSEYASRFSEFKQDLTKYPKAYYTEDQLKEKAEQTFNALKADS